MYYKITHIEKDARVPDRGSLTRVVAYVSFWKDEASSDGPPQWVEDFHIDVARSRKRIARDRDNNFLTVDDVAVSPDDLRPSTLEEAENLPTYKWKYETVQLDVADQITAVIERYLDRKPNKKGDQTDHQVRTITRDTSGVLQLQKVRNLIGTGKTRELKR